MFYIHQLERRKKVKEWNKRNVITFINLRFFRKIIIFVILLFRALPAQGIRTYYIIIKETQKGK